MFLGRDMEDVAGREVALKVLDLADVDDMKQVELFERQRPLLVQLCHRGIPTVFDAFDAFETGSAPTGRRVVMLVLVQSLHRGPNLRDALASGLRFDEVSARAFLDRMLDILEYLHALSPPILHRDIKPSNILLELSEGHDTSMSLVNAQPILIDFDTARGVAIDTAAADGTMVGSAGFVPMEQLAGRPVPASDLYGLGVTMIAALSQRDILDIPIKRSRLQFHEFVNVSRALRSVLDKMIAPNVEDRFQDVAAVRRALATSSPAAAAPRVESNTSPASDVPRRYGLVLALGAAAIVAVGLGLFVVRDAPRRSAGSSTPEGGQQPLRTTTPETQLAISCELSFDTSCATWQRIEGPLTFSGTTLVIGGQGVAHVDALFGDTVAPGLPKIERSASSTLTVYARDGADWIQRAILSGAREGARLHSPILSGDRIVALEDEPMVAGRETHASIVMFVRDKDTWSPIDPALERVPSSVRLALDGETLVVGGPEQVRVYIRDGERWMLQTTLDVLAPRQVALDGSTLAVGGLSGIHIFTRSGPTWLEQGVIRDPAPSSRPSVGRQFGHALALHDDLLAVTTFSTNYNVVGDDQKPEVLVYERSSADGSVTWRPKRRLAVSAVKEGYSISLAFDRETLVVSVPGLVSETHGWHGALFSIAP